MCKRNRKFKMDSKYNPTVYANIASKSLINYDLPDTYYFKDNRWVLVIDGSYGVMSYEYLELTVDEQKEVLEFIVESAKAFYSWSYNWKSRAHDKNCLAFDVNNFVSSLMRNTFMSVGSVHLKSIDYLPMDEGDRKCLAA